MFFRYPAATTSATVLGTRWCSKLYLRTAWVSSPNAAFRAASDTLETVAATAGCAVPGTASVFSPWEGSPAGSACEVFGDLPQQVRSTTMRNGRTTRKDMLQLDRSIRKIQDARLLEGFAVNFLSQIKP